MVIRSKRSEVRKTEEESGCPISRVLCEKWGLLMFVNGRSQGTKSGGPGCSPSTAQTCFRKGLPFDSFGLAFRHDKFSRPSHHRLRRLNFQLHRAVLILPRINP